MIFLRVQNPKPIIPGGSLFREMISLHVPNSRALFGENGEHLKVDGVLRSVAIISSWWFLKS